jgi:hypothetical protein
MRDALLGVVPLRWRHRLSPKPAKTHLFRVPFVPVILVGVAICGLATVLPTGHGLMPVKLAIATWGTLILPGAVILRLLGWPRSLSAAIGGCATWSVAAVAAGFVLMLATDGGRFVALLWLLAVIAVGLILGRGKPVEVELRLSAGLLLLVASSVAFMAVLWLGSWNNVGDAVEHIARMRKISELNPPRALDELGLLPPDAGLHPGYAFPLWHAVGAVIVWLSSLEETVMFRYWPVALFPIVGAVIYRAGSVVFGSRAAGIATLVGYLGAFSFPWSGVGFFSLMSYPGYICIFLFWPLVIERTFTFLREGGREPLCTAAAASFAVSAIHPSYAPFMIMLIAAFVAARLAIERDRTEIRRMGLALGAVTAPFLLFLIWLFPAADSSASTRAHGTAHFASLVNTYGDLTSMKAEWLTRGGPIAIAALICAPLAGAATRKRAGVFIASTTLVVLLTLLVPWLFSPFADVMSVSQGRRFLFYLPWAFALTGGALVLARFRWFAVAGAFALGVALHFRWRGDFSYHLKGPGPGWVAWLAAAAILVVLVLGVARKLNIRYGNGWALAIVVAFVLPVAVAGIKGMKTHRPEPSGFNAQLLAAVDKYVSRDDVVLALPKTAYRLSALAPVYIVAAAGGHGGDTVVNQHAERRRDAKGFFVAPTTAEEAESVIDRWHVQWVLVRKNKWYPREYLQQFTPVYEGKHFALYPVDPAIMPRVDELKHSGD